MLATTKVGLLQYPLNRWVFRSMAATCHPEKKKIAASNITQTANWEIINHTYTYIWLPKVEIECHHKLPKTRTLQIRPCLELIE